MVSMSFGGCCPSGSVWCVRVEGSRWKDLLSDTGQQALRASGYGVFFAYPGRGHELSQQLVSMMEAAFGMDACQDGSAGLSIIGAGFLAECREQGIKSLGLQKTLLGPCDQPMPSSLKFRGCQAQHAELIDENSHGGSAVGNRVITLATDQATFLLVFDQPMIGAAGEGQRIEP